MTDLYLIEPSIELEADAMKYRSEHLEYGESHIHGSLRFEQYDNYGEWLEKVMSAHKKETSSIGVPATTYFTVRKDDKKIIGTIQLRHELNDELLKRAGHIGYGIAPSERGKGYGTKQLFLALEKAKELGIGRVMISCDKTNIASASVAIKNGGKFEQERYDERDGLIEIYWIDLM